MVNLTAALNYTKGDEAIICKTSIMAHGESRYSDETKSRPRKTTMGLQFVILLLFLVFLFTWHPCSWALKVSPAVWVRYQRHSHCIGHGWPFSRRATGEFGATKPPRKSKGKAYKRFVQQLQGIPLPIFSEHSTLQSDLIIICLHGRLEMETISVWSHAATRSAKA